MIKELNTTNLTIAPAMNAFTNAWNIHDATAFASLFATDASFTNVFGQQLQGQESIEAVHKAIFETVFSNSQLIITSLSERRISDELIAADAYWTMTGAVDIHGNPWENRKGLLNFIMKQTGNGWSILIMHNMDLPKIASPVNN